MESWLGQSQSNLSKSEKKKRSAETAQGGMLSSPPMSSAGVGESGDNKEWISRRGSISSSNAQECSYAVRAPVAGPSVSFSSPPGRKHLRPEKWHAAFDNEGRLVGFRKVLKRILLGGIDPSIRAEVWEFLLGCYSLNSTTEYREQLRISRRKRYKDLIDQCRLMNSSVGTGCLPYAVGSKVMDMRIKSKDNAMKEAKMSVERIAREARVKLQSPHSVWNKQSVEASHGCKLDSYSLTDSVEIANVIENTESVFNPFSFISSTGPASSACSESDKEDCETLYQGNIFEFAYLPVTNLFGEDEKVKSQFSTHNKGSTYAMNDSNYRENPFLDSSLDVWENGYRSPGLQASEEESNIASEDLMHGIREKNSLTNVPGEHPSDVNGLCHHLQTHRKVEALDYPNARNSPITDAVVVLGVKISEERVADWLWTLHKIVVDVVRTDRHLEFYEDTKNMARMSDVLAVYAWVDPMTGYCQGMSDLLSPFLVLFEDDADAFWCFESLIRRMRPNFQMEGPVGVMKQLETLGKILQLADHQLFKHLALIGAESLLFAFRMLLVLFRRELSFNDALCMWEMMWAADFDEELISALEHECLEPLILSPPDTINGHLHHDSGEHFTLSKGDQSDEGEVKSPISENSYVKYLSKSPFCGLRPGDLWNKHNQHQIRTMNSVLKKNGDAEMSVFCVAAILVINRSKIIREIQSMDDAIKMFNEMPFEIKVKHCIHMALKLRKKYFHKNNKHGASKKSSASHSS